MWLKKAVMAANSREFQLNELELFIDESKIKLNAVLKQLQWTNEKTFDVEKEKKKSSVTTEPTWPAARYSILLDSEKLSNVITKRVDSCSSLSTELLPPDQKLAIYDYCIEKTGRLSEPEMSIMIYPDDGGSKKEMTFAEIVAEKRNAKRRTVRYRTGVSHSYLSEVRNLIELQMSALSQYASDTKKVKKSSKDKGDSDREFFSSYSTSVIATTSSSQHESSRHNQVMKSSSSSSEWKHNKRDRTKTSRSRHR